MWIRILVEDSWKTQKWWTRDKQHTNEKLDPSQRKNILLDLLQTRPPMKKRKHIEKNAVIVLAIASTNIRSWICFFFVWWIWCLWEIVVALADQNEGEDLHDFSSSESNSYNSMEYSDNKLEEIKDEEDI